MSLGIEQLVERNVGLAALRARRADSELAELGPRLPVITVSREPFAGGTTIARLTADRLGFALWDRDLLKRIAEQNDAIESVLVQVDERVNSSVHDFIRSLLAGDVYSQDTYRINLTKVVGSIALNGAAVIVGRGGQLILHGQRVLRVRVVCPFEERVRRAMHHEGLSEQEATKLVKEYGAAMKAFVKHQFDQDIGAPEHYDLILNTGALSANQAAEIVVASYQTKFHRSGITVPPPKDEDEAPMDRHHPRTSHTAAP